MHGLERLWEKCGINSSARSFQTVWFSSFGTKIEVKFRMYFGCILIHFALPKIDTVNELGNFQKNPKTSGGSVAVSRMKLTSWGMKFSRVPPVHTLTGGEIEPIQILGREINQTLDKVWQTQLITRNAGKRIKSEPEDSLNGPKPPVIKRQNLSFVTNKTPGNFETFWLTGSPLTRQAARIRSPSGLQTERCVCSLFLGPIP